MGNVLGFDSRTRIEIGVAHEIWLKQHLLYTRHVTDIVFSEKFEGCTICCESVLSEHDGRIVLHSTFPHALLKARVGPHLAYCLATKEDVSVDASPIASMVVYATHPEVSDLIVSRLATGITTPYPEFKRISFTASASAVDDKVAAYICTSDSPSLIFVWLIYKVHIEGRSLEDAYQKMTSPSFPSSLERFSTLLKQT